MSITSDRNQFISFKENILQNCSAQFLIIRILFLVCAIVVIETLQFAHGTKQLLITLSPE